jgi:hypothetical protein
MPIANCLVKDIEIIPEEWEKMVTDLAAKAKLQVTEITLNVITGGWQFGNPYKVMITLYLPTLWNSVDIELIQKSLLSALTSNLNLPPEDIFIMTSLVESGNVVENGKMVWW